MTSSIRKYAASPSKRSHKGSVFKSFHPGPRFKKRASSGSAFTGFVWTIGQNDAKRVCLYQKVFPCGWPLRIKKQQMLQFFSIIVISTHTTHIYNSMPTPCAGK